MRPKCLADVKGKETEWLWPYRIPRGKVTGLAGDPGCGKSFATMKICSDLSSGTKLPGGIELPPQKILYLTTEDGLEDTVKPRIEKMGADPNYFFGHDEPIYLDTDGHRDLREMVLDIQPALVVFDTITGFTRGKVDTRKANEVRETLHPLKQLAEDTNSSIIFLCHLNKSEGTKGLNRISGSMDYVGLARSFLLAGKSIQDGADRALFHIKSNLGPESEPLGYSLKDGIFQWTGPSQLKIEDILSIGRSSSKKQSAKEFLINTLLSGPKAQREVEIYAEKLGITGATLRRAKEDLCIVSKQEHSLGKHGGSQWFWALASNSQLMEERKFPEGIAFSPLSEK